MESVSQSNIATNGDQSRPLSACCMAPVKVWVHHREEKAGCNTSARAIVVCAKCKGPADGSRPEEWSFPWRLIRPESDEGGAVFRRRDG